MSKFPFHLGGYPDKAELLKEYGGKLVDELPTPSFLIDLQKFKNNSSKMLQNSSKLKTDFRVHVKTHKAIEGSEIELGTGPTATKKILVSTLVEAWFLLPLVNKGLVDDVLFSLPVVQSRIGEFEELNQKIPHFRIMVDQVDQLEALVNYSKNNSVTNKWSIFIKINMGTNRAGLTIESSGLLQTLQKALVDEGFKEYVEIYGFYCHAGHSYSSDTKSLAKKYLLDEIKHANEAAKLALGLAPTSNFVLSVGATPTAHATELITYDDVISEIGELSGQLELHAGNYACCDLQQVATGCVGLDDVSVSVLAEVVSSYPDRGGNKPGEQLINAGAIALSKDQSSLPGFGVIYEPQEYNQWIVGRISQEHGILVPSSPDISPAFIPLGTKIKIIPQHACLSSVAYPWYYVIENGKVVDIWVPCKGW